MSIGEKIKELRVKKGMSQSELAERLHVSAQAISKWENEQSYPDIALLPEIAACFGIMIDDLFAYAKEKEYEKIEHMIENQRWLSNEEFMQAESFLLKEMEHDLKNSHAPSLLGDLYHFEATRLEMKAAHYARIALRLNPNNKFDINTINNAMRGGMMDWNVNNHHQLIDVYYDILKENPANKRVYFYLLDNLITDGRLSEAKQALTDSRCVQNDVIHDYYEVCIEEKKHGFEAVKDKYHALGIKHADQWRILISLGDAFASNEHYEDAIKYYTLAFEAMEKPRYTDFLESIAQLHVHLGNTEKAIEAYRQEIQLLKEEWDIDSGESVDRVRELIEKLKQG